MLKRIILLLGVFCVATCFSGCSGSSDGGNGGVGTPSDISGVAFKGPILNGTVEVYAITASGQKGSLLATTKTSSVDGSYSVSFSHAGAVLIEVSGGKYEDEATGSMVDLKMTLRAVVASVGGDLSVAVTPLTELATQEAEKAGLSAATITTANAKLSQLLGTNGDILSTLPVDVNNSTQMASANIEEKLYGFLLAAFSEMAREHASGLEGVMEALGDDLSDGKLNNTGADLVDALLGYGDAVPDELSDILDDLAGGGFTPTGDLAEAKAKLSALLNENPPTAATYNEFVNYMNSFVADSAEAHLLKALAGMMDLYNSEAVNFVKNAYGDGGLGFDFGFDFDKLDEDSIYYDAGFADDFETRLKLLASDETNIDGMLAEMESRLVELDSELVLAEGTSSSLSVNGVDTVYFDTLDVKVMRAWVAYVKAMCAYLQAIELDVANWNVTVGSVLTDVRDLITTDTEITDAMRDEFVANNPNLLKYDETSKIAAFTAAVSSAQTHLSAAVSGFEALDSAGRTARSNNAFTIETELDLYEIKAVAEEMLPSIIDAFSDSAARIKGLESDQTDAAFEEPGDGYAYYQEIHTVRLVEFEPAGTLTINALIDGTKTPRDVALAAIASADASTVFQPYTEAGSTIYQDNVTETNWDRPYKIYTVPENNSISIDGNSADWDAVPIFEQLGGVTVKLARNSGGKLFAHVSMPSTESINFYLYSSDSISYSNYAQISLHPSYADKYTNGPVVPPVLVEISPGTEYEVDFGYFYDELAFSGSTSWLSFYTFSQSMYKSVKLKPEVVSP